MSDQETRDRRQRKLARGQARKGFKSGKSKQRARMLRQLESAEQRFDIAKLGGTN